MTLTVSYESGAAALPKIWLKPSSLGVCVLIQVELIWSHQMETDPWPTTAAPRTYRGKEAIKISSYKVFHSSITDGLEGGSGNTESSCGWLELRNSCSFAVGLHHLSHTSFSFDLLRDVNFTYVAALNVISLCYYFCNWGWKDFNIRHCICLSDQILIALVLRKKKMRVWVTAFTTPFLTSCKTHIFYYF